MATAAVARPTNALRTRRDGPRPNMAPKRASGISMDTGSAGEPSHKKRKLSEPFVITREHVLRKFKGQRPSLVLHLHQSYFRFDGMDGSFPYDSAMKPFIQHLRNQTVPHEMLEELLSGNVPFYDGCLIVEVHNHKKSSGNEKARHDSAGAEGDQVKYSMHNYNNYVTPSPFAPYPKKATESDATPKAEAAEEAAREKPGNDKSKTQDGPQISTMVMFPTDLSKHREMLILANTPASEMRSKKRSTDGMTPSGAQPPTPQLSSASLAQSGRLAGQDQKMCLEESDFYQFQADLLLATEPPLFLEPAKNPQEAQAIMDMLAHPLHVASPPSPKTRKRTTAEMAADDAQAAESERRMLIMDERIKQTAPGTSDTAGNAQAMGFSRFKTIQMVREKHEEQERLKKEEEAQQAIQRRQQDEAEKAENMRKTQQAEQQRAIMARRAAAARQHQEQLRHQQIQQQAMLAAQSHAHPQQNNMMMNQQNGNFQLSASMPQASPVVRQQTPMMNSSPMLQQGGFPMTATSSQGAGSPPRPTSGAIPNPALAMARQASQQAAQASRNATPQMAQGTPSMPGVMPSRQMSQTPRLAHGSPAPGTPGTNIANMPLPTPQQNGITPEQLAMLQARQAQLAQAGIAAGSPGQQGMGQQQMTPEQIQVLRQRQAQQAHLMQQAIQAGHTPQQAQMLVQQQQSQLIAQRRQQQMNQQRLMMQQQQQQNANAGQAGSPHPGMPTQQMYAQQGGDMQAQQRQAQLRVAQQQLQMLAQQHGGWANIPQQVIQTLHPNIQVLWQNQTRKIQAHRAQQMARTAQAAQSSGQAVAGSGTADPEYMQTLRQHQEILLQQQARQGGQGQMNGMSMTHNMNFSNMQGQQFGGQSGGGGADLSRQFQAMQNALSGNGGMGQ